MISEDEYLERIVAGIHSATSEGADVTWNETIDGRQFDVTVRFQIGTMRYLVLVEVKNKNRKSSASEIEAFVTKTRDNNSNKSVFVTAAGFQSGAIKIAQKHGIELFTVKFNHQKIALSQNQTRVIINKKQTTASMDSNLELGPETPVNIISNIRLHYTNGKTIQLPNEPSQLDYYVTKTQLSNGQTLEQVIRKRELNDNQTGGPNIQTINFLPPTLVNPVDEYFFPRGNILSLDFEVKRSSGRPINGNTQIEPTSFSHPVIYKNAITNEEIELNIHQLPLGSKNLEVGKFYFQTHPLIYFYCNNIENNQLDMYIVESFQNCEIFTARVRQHTKYSNHYIPVTHKPTIKRLELRLADFISRLTR